ncbi:MAG: apolipoprotein N-acyltransferase [Deltaproteobacteria bacterium]|nr:apolipoprotein N-acyltransferase [Deltaproteobacteria bacterium]
MDRRFSRPILLRAVLTAAIGGIAIGFGGAPYEAYAIAWLGPAAIVLALRGLADAGDHHGLRRAALVGLAAGIGSNATTCAWVVDLLTTYAYLPAPLAWLVASLLFLAQSLPFVLGAMLAFGAHRMARDLVGARAPTIEIAHPIATVIAASAAPMIFPWRIGNSQTGLLALAQIAEIGGLPLLDLVLGVASTLALCAVLPGRSVRARLSLAVAACACLGLPALWGAHRLEEVRAERDAAPSITVGLVQHDFDIPDRMDMSQWESQLGVTFTLSHALEREGVDVLLWPESSFPWGLDRDRLGLGADPRAYPVEMGLREQRFGVPIVLGAMTRDSTDVYNTVLAIDDTRVLGVVDKTRLMPFSERIPAWEWLPFLHPFLRPGLSLGPREGGTIDVAGQRLGILNCYEDLMADHVWRVTQHGPTVLSNHTNDAWFGRTRAPGLHHFLARMRAIETRRDLVRTVNTGVSGVIASSGETIVETEVFERTTLRVRVHALEGRTWWVRVGDVTSAAAWGMCLALLLRWARRRMFGDRDPRAS